MLQLPYTPVPVTIAPHVLIVSHLQTCRLYISTIASVGYASILHTASHILRFLFVIVLHGAWTKCWKLSQECFLNPTRGLLQSFMSCGRAITFLAPLETWCVAYEDGHVLLQPLTTLKALLAGSASHEQTFTCMQVRLHVWLSKNHYYAGCAQYCVDPLLSCCSDRTQQILGAL